MAKILICDDDDDMVEFFRRLFTRKGHELIVAQNASDGVSMTVESKPDIVFMDMNMPVSDGEDVGPFAGLDATKQIRQIGELAALPIIALTGNVMPGQREKILGAGCNEMLEKPIENFADLFAALDRHVGP